MAAENCEFQPRRIRKHASQVRPRKDFAMRAYEECGERDQSSQLSLMHKAQSLGQEQLKLSVSVLAGGVVKCWRKRGGSIEPRDECQV